MISKLKTYLNTALAFVVVILGGILFNRNRKVQSLESELAKERADDAIKQNEEDRQAAKQNADELVASYERLKNEKD